MKIFYGSASSDKDESILQAHWASCWIYCTRRPDDGLFVWAGDGRAHDYMPWEEGFRQATFTAPHPHCTHRSSKAEHRQEYNERMSAIRNRLIEAFLESDCDYLWFCDADVVPFPNVLQQLISLAQNEFLGEGHAVAAVVRNGPIGVYNYLRQNPDGTYRRYHPSPLALWARVDLSGACWLVPRKPIEEGARYSHHEAGNDASFCEAIRQSGIDIVVGLQLHTFHHMDPDQPPLWSHEGSHENLP